MQTPFRLWESLGGGVAGLSGQQGPGTQTTRQDAGFS